MFVIKDDLLAAFVDRLPEALQPLLVTEAVIRLALINELLRIVHIDARFHALTLYIRSDRAAFLRSFVP